MGKLQFWILLLVFENILLQKGTKREILFAFKKFGTILHGMQITVTSQ